MSAADRRKIEVLAFKTGRPLYAYDIVLDALERASSSRKEGRRGASAETLCRALIDEAVDRYGILASHVLKFHGILTTHDVGRITYEMIGTGVLFAQHEDSLDGFLGLFDLHAEVESRSDDHVRRIEV